MIHQYANYVVITQPCVVDFNCESKFFQIENSYLLKQKYILEVSKEVSRGHKNRSNTHFKFSLQLHEKEHLVLKLKDRCCLSNRAFRI